VVRKRIVGLLLALMLPGSVAGAQQAMPCEMSGMRMGEGRGMMMDSVRMARMDSVTSSLDSLRRVMNGTSGARKTQAMAAILDAMVQHHVDMQRHMHDAMAGGGPDAMGGKGAAGRCKMGAAAADSAATGGQHQHQ
jgi:hypothetical protein